MSPKRTHPQPTALLVVALLSVLTLGLSAYPQETGGDKKVGKTFIHIVSQNKKEIVFEPALPAKFVGRLDNGALNSERLFECDVWTVTKLVRDVQYPAMELRCGAVQLTITGIDMVNAQ